MSKLTVNPKKALTALCLMIQLLAKNAPAQTSYYFDVNGTSVGSGVVDGGSYGWDGNWSTDSGLASASGNWVAGGIAYFTTGPANYSVTVSGDESVAGVINTQTTGVLTINSSGAGDLDVASGDANFLNTSGSEIINAPITGTGTLTFGSSSGSTTNSVALYGNNTYSGGTSLSRGWVTFNNNNSFGTGGIYLSSGLSVAAATGGTAITLANNVTVSSTGAGVNIITAPNTPVISTGNWSLGANNLVLQISGNKTASLTIAGLITGTAGVTFRSQIGGTIILNQAVAYSGMTTISKVGGTTGAILELGVANALAASSEVSLSGGTLNLGGYNQNMANTTLGVGGVSAIDFEDTSSASFANSSALSWGSTLDLTNWVAGTTSLQVGTDDTGLTTAQLSRIEFNGDAATLGAANLDANGYVIDSVPEPASLALSVFGGLCGIGFARMRRNA